MALLVRYSTKDFNPDEEYVVIVEGNEPLEDFARPGFMPQEYVELEDSAVTMFPCNTELIPA